MVYATRTLTGNGSGTQNSTAVPLNWRAEQIQVSVLLDTNGSTTGATVQATLDDVQDSTVTPTWFTISGHSFPKTADYDFGITLPYRAIRLQVNASGTDVITMTVLQG